RHLGKYNAAGQLMTRTCAEYRQVLDLLVNRGTPTFAPLSERLYRSSADRAECRALAPQVRSDSRSDAATNLADLGRMLAAPRDNVSRGGLLTSAEPILDAREAVRLLSARLAEFFQDPSAVRVRLSDGIVADAAAGGNCIKLRADACFTLREIRL